MSLDYPNARKSDHVDLHHGVEVPDPYRWMEDMGSDEVKGWVDAQNTLTRQVLDTIPGRTGLAERLSQLMDYERFGVPTEAGGRLFMTRNDGLQNQDVLEVCGPEGEDRRVLVDPNTFSADGTSALSTWVPSKDGAQLLFARADSGSDWVRWHVVDVASGAVVDDAVRWSKFGAGTWDKQGKGFYYLRFPQPEEGKAYAETNMNPVICHHLVGTSQDQDREVFSLPEHPDWWIWPWMPDDKSAMVVVIPERGTTHNRLWVIDPEDPAKPVVKLFDASDADYDPVDVVDGQLLLATTRSAPLGKIIRVRLDRPADGLDWEELVPESADVLQSVQRVGPSLFLTYLHDAKSRVVRMNLDGGDPRAVELPGLGTAVGFSGGAESKRTFFGYVDFCTPLCVYRYDLETGGSSLFRKPNLPVDTSQYQAEQVFYASKDGTRIPMFLISKRGTQRNGELPVLLGAYGGFNIPVVPSFSSVRLLWLEMGGVLAIANLRGGGEYGKAWHLAGTKLNKQNVFDDFIAAAEWLIAQGYTRSGRLAIQGGSNGGLLVGACMTQRPELFGVALPAVGVMDMLRFNQFTVGKGWEGDYGSPANEDEFRALLAYSPYHNLKDGVSYPATMVTTADTDDRVVPCHSYKFGARLQEAHAGANPVLVRVETSAGHGAGKPLSKQIEEASDVLAFTAWRMGVSLG